MKVNSWNANVGSSYQRSRRNTWRSNAAFNLQKDKITLQSSIDLGDRRFLRNWNNDLYYPDAHWENRGITDFKNNYYAVKAALDYKVNERLTLGTKFNASLFDTKNNGTPSFQIFMIRLERCKSISLLHLFNESNLSNKSITCIPNTNWIL